MAYVSIKFLILAFVSAAFIGTNLLAAQTPDEEESSRQIDYAPPGDSEPIYTPDQNENYEQAIDLRIPARSRFVFDLWYFSRNAILQDFAESDQPYETIYENMQIPSEWLEPTNVEIAQRETMLMNAFNVPFVKTYVPGAGLISVGQIATFLGLVEDTSPNIVFSLDAAVKVEIVIYSTNAQVVRTIYRGTLTPGSHRYVWDGKSDEGLSLPPGDYVAEVRIGGNKYVRKWIRWR